MTAVALPLFKIELSYQVRHGRRWTALEHLLLWAVAQNARSLADLRDGASMPTRVIVEALVNLLKVGWIELTTASPGSGGPVLFTANGRGRSALSEDELPYAYELQRRYAVLFVERLTAHVLKEDQVETRHLQQLDTSRTLVLQPSRETYDASPSRFFDVLRLQPNDCFERHLNHRISSTAQYAMLDVVGERVAGLPEDAPARLLESVLKHVPAELRSPGGPGDWTAAAPARRLTDRENFAVADIAASDLLVGGRDHLCEIKRMLREARGVVYVHSTFLGAVMEAFQADFEGAAARDVDVVLLWGERRDRDGEDPNQSEVKGRLAHTKMGLEARERVRLAPDPTGSHAKILLADSGPDGAFEAVVGSCNWLSADYSCLELSVRLREPRLVMEVAGLLADMSLPASGAWGQDVTTLFKVQDRCRIDALRLASRAPPDGPRAMLVIDDEHYAAVRDARNAPARTALVGCDLFGVAGETTVFEPLGTAGREQGTAVRALYNRPTDSFCDRLDKVVARFAGPAFAVDRVRGLHGKFLAWDQTLVVTSFNWLAASARPPRLSAGEVGVLIQDPELAPTLARRIASAARVVWPSAPGPGR